MYKAHIAAILAILLFAGPVTTYANDIEYQFKVKRGDSLSKYFAKLGLSNRLLANLLSADKRNKNLNKLTIGNKITIKLNKKNRFKSLNYQLGNNKNLNIILKNSRFYTSTSRKNKLKSNALVKTVVNIKNSFGQDAQKTGINIGTINTIVGALSWEINFSKDLKKGDKFTIINAHKTKPDAIIFSSKNNYTEIFSHTDKNGKTDYYDRHGNSLQQSFLKAPLKYKRISSKFQLQRYHPILKTWRPHRAVDYAAEYGTPVYSVAKGVIKSKGRKGALGNALVIQHGSNYTTVYAHLSKFARGIRNAKKVKRGQVIGYVGSTGRSTGPHLHYEIRYKGKRKNPLSYKLPKQKSINKSQLWEFKNKVNNIVSQL